MGFAIWVSFQLIFGVRTRFASNRVTRRVSVGWKTNLVIIDQLLDEATVLKALGREGYSYLDQLKGEDLFPSNDFVMGAHNGCTIIGDSDLADAFTTDYESAETQSLVTRLGGSRVVACVLHSVVNLAAFSLFNHGRLERAYACATDDGVFVDEGEMLECEKRVYAEYGKKTLEDGSVVFFDDHDEFDQSSLGEDVVFELLATVLGKRPDMDDDLFEIDIQRYAGRTRGFFSKLFGG